MLKLICGPSGSGKTAVLIESIRRDVECGRRCYLLVPEQQAYISERALLETLPPNAGLYFEVVSFSSLADDVFRARGGASKITVDTGLSMLLMWDTIRNHSDTASNAEADGACRKKLIQYGKGKAIDSALTSLMLSTVEELRSSGITPAELERAAEHPDVDPHLAEKLSDIALISSAYHTRLEETFKGDPADKLELLAKLLGEHGDFFEGCNVYVDSFTSFTAPEYRILAAVMRHATSLTVTLCADKFNSSRPHFASIKKTEERLAGWASHVGCTVIREQAPLHHSDKPLELQILSESIWDFSVKKEQKQRIPKSERGAVRLLSANNVYEEAEAAALYICEQVQNGMRYRDIAVIVRDAENYRGILDAAFERYGIPYFISERTDLSSMPLSRLILCALRTAAHGFRRPDVIALLKTGLCGIAPEDAAMFEEYCETWHISGGRFKDDVWSMHPDGLTTEKPGVRASLILKTANEVRAALIPKLTLLSDRLRKPGSLREYCEALYDYLVAIDLPRRLEELAKRERASRRRREEAETLRLYRHLIKMLSTVCRILPNTTVNANEFITALSLLLSNTDLGSIPNEQDCVMIGSASMLRVENVRASLLLGLCEGEFPAAVNDNGIFNDTEKTFLEGLDKDNKLAVFFASKTMLRNAEELFYVYRAIAKPSERLLLSTVKKQTDGSARVPSLAFHRAYFLLKDEADAEALVIESFDAADVLTARNGSTEPRRTHSLSAPPVISPISLSLSQSRISAFVKCPYMHYLKYMLNLRETKDAMPTYADDGTFLHYVFEKFLSRNPLHETVSEEEITELVDVIIEEYVKEFLGGSVEWIGERILHQLAHLRHLALLMLHDILEEIRESAFEPVAFEKNIGKGQESLPAVELQLKNGSAVRLTGTIDRIDVCEIDGRQWIRVVDYKTGEHVFSPSDVADGSDIQLVLYLHAYLSAHPDAAAYGAQYVYGKTEDGITTVQRSGFYLGDGEINAAVGVQQPPKKMTAQSAEEIETLRSVMQQTVKSIAERMLAGDARKTPSEEACKYCIIKGNCDLACLGKE